MEPKVGDPVLSLCGLALGRVTGVDEDHFYAEFDLPGAGRIEFKYRREHFERMQEFEHVCVACDEPIVRWVKGRKLCEACEAKEPPPHTTRDRMESSNGGS